MSFLHAGDDDFMALNPIQSAKLLHNFLKNESFYKKDTIPYYFLTFQPFNIDLHHVVNSLVWFFNK